MRLSVLADRLFLDKSTTSRVVSTLVRKRYVEQRPDPADRRATIVSATGRGHRLCARITDDLVAQQRQLLQDLDPEIRDGVVQVLRRLAQAADARFRAGCAESACCGTGDDSPACV